MKPTEQYQQFESRIRQQQSLSAHPSAKQFSPISAATSADVIGFHERFFWIPLPPPRDARESFSWLRPGGSEGFERVWSKLLTMDTAKSLTAAEGRQIRSRRRVPLKSCACDCLPPSRRRCLPTARFQPRSFTTFLGLDTRKGWILARGRLVVYSAPSHQVDWHFCER